MDEGIVRSSSRRGPRPHRGRRRRSGGEEVELDGTRSSSRRRRQHGRADDARRSPPRSGSSPLVGALAGLALPSPKPSPGCSRTPPRMTTRLAALGAGRGRGGPSGSLRAGLDGARGRHRRSAPLLAIPAQSPWFPIGLARRAEPRSRHRRRPRRRSSSAAAHRPRCSRRAPRAGPRDVAHPSIDPMGAATAALGPRPRPTSGFRHPGGHRRSPLPRAHRRPLPAAIAVVGTFAQRARRAGRRWCSAPASTASRDDPGALRLGLGRRHRGRRDLTSFGGRDRSGRQIGRGRCRGRRRSTLYTQVPFTVDGTPSFATAVVDSPRATSRRSWCRERRRSGATSWRWAGTRSTASSGRSATRWRRLSSGGPVRPMRISGIVALPGARATEAPAANGVYLSPASTAASSGSRPCARATATRAPEPSPSTSGRASTSAIWADYATSDPEAGDACRGACRARPARSTASRPSRTCRGTSPSSWRCSPRSPSASPRPRTVRQRPP